MRVEVAPLGSLEHNVVVLHDGEPDLAQVPILQIARVAIVDATSRDAWRPQALQPWQYQLLPWHLCKEGQHARPGMRAYDDLQAGGLHPAHSCLRAQIGPGGRSAEGQRAGAYHFGASAQGWRRSALCHRVHAWRKGCKLYLLSTQLTTEARSCKLFRVARQCAASDWFSVVMCAPSWHPAPALP